MFSQGNEIVTFALGHYSSHVATHFYNIQEASFSYNPNFKTGINHDALFRESSHHSKATYTPRLIIADDSEALGFLSKDGCYKNNDNFPAENNIEADLMVKEKMWEVNEFINDYIKEKQKTERGLNFHNDFLLKNSYNLDDSIKSWTDYLVSEFNRKTIVTLPRNTDYYDNYEGFSNFESGVSLWNKTTLSEDIEENTRFFMEEVDRFQGFQVIFDGDNGYSGIGCSCLEFLHDEYNKKPILAIPVLFADTSETIDIQTQHRKRCERIYSISSGLSLSSQYCDIMTPMSHLMNPWGKNRNIRSFSNITYKQNSMYHTSAMLAAALDLITLPCRMESQSTSLNNIVTMINMYGRSIAAVGLNVPLPVKCGEDVFSAIEKVANKCFDSLTPLMEINSENIDIQSVATKGLGKAQGNLNPESIQGFLKTYLNNNFPRVISTTSICKSSFRVPRTFPKVLDEQFNLSPSDNCYGPLAEFVAIGGMHNGREIGNVLNNLYDSTKPIKIKRIPGFGPKDSEIDYNEIFEDLKNLSFKYSDISYM